MSDIQQQKTIGLVDIVRPLVRYWKILAIGLFVLAVAFFAMTLFAKQVTIMDMSFKVYPLMYSDYSEIANRLNDKDSLDKFFTKENLGVDPEAILVSQAGSSSLVHNRYFMIDYYRLDDKPTTPDPFKGVYSTDDKLIQKEQASFYLRLASVVNDPRVMENIAQRIVEDYIASIILEYYIDRNLEGRMITYSKYSINSDTLRYLRSLKEDEALLVKMQREFPSLIRTNLTLNENTVPIEVQLIEKRKEISKVERSISDYYVSLPMLKAFSTFIEKERSLSSFSTFSSGERQALCGKLSTLVKDVFDESAYTLDPSTDEEELRVKMNEESASLIKAFSFLADETRVPLSALIPSEKKVESSSSKIYLYLIVLLIVLLLVPYIIYSSKDIFNKLRGEKGSIPMEKE